jgi:HAD superfamily hydrolase (TIGR01456 family)
MHRPLRKAFHHFDDIQSRLKKSIQSHSLPKPQFVPDFDPDAKLGLSRVSAIDITSETSTLFTPEETIPAADAVHDVAILWDNDGVFETSGIALPHAHDVFSHIHKVQAEAAAEPIESNVDDSPPRKLFYSVLTNSGGYPESVRVAMLNRQYNVEIPEDSFIQSHTPFLGLVERHRDDIVLVVGGVGNNVRDVARLYGFRNPITPSDLYVAESRIWPFAQATGDYHREHAKPLPIPIDLASRNKSLRIGLVLIFNSSRDVGLDLQILTDLMLSDGGRIGHLGPQNGNPKLPNHGYQQDDMPPLYACNPDFVWATSYHQPRFSQGFFLTSLRALFAEATNQRASLRMQLIGKPHHATFEYAENTLRERRDRLLGRPCTRPFRLYMIGDNPESDIAGGNAYRSAHGSTCDTILVATGAWRAGTQPAHKPTVAVADCKEALNYVLAREGMPLLQ